MGLRTRLVASLVGLALVAVSATTAQASSHGSSTTTTTTIPPQGIVKIGATATVAVPYLPSEFNPATPSGENPVTAMVMQQVWPQPFVVNGNLQPVLALDSRSQPSLLGPSGAELESVRPETIVYNLNPKARWSDGVPITASDFIYNWHEQVAEGDLLPATDPLSGYEDIASVTGSNHGKTVTVVFAKPYTDWESLFTNLVPAHIAERYGWAQAFASFDPQKLISGGPFIITKFVPGKELVLSHNPHYWADAPELGHIVFEVESTDATIRGLEAGTIDAAQLPPGKYVNTLSDLPTLAVQPSLSTTLWQIAFNLADPTVASVNVRQAIASVIDRNQLVSNTIGFLLPFNSVSGNRVYGAGAPGSQGDDSAYSTVDPTTADQLFDGVGDEVDGNGTLIDSTGSPVVLTIDGPSGSALIDAVESELQAQLLQAGITLHIHNVPQSSLLETVLPSGSYQLALAPYAVSPYPSTTAALYDDPVGPTPDASSFIVAPTTTVPTPVVTAVPTHVAGDKQEPDARSFGAVTRDVLGFSDPAVSALYAQARLELNASAASALYNRIDTLLWADMPTLPLFQTPVMLVTQRELGNVSDTQTPVGPMWNAQDWTWRILPPPTTTTVAP